ncbi:right-handed parallel beta-helix repeat-containing protein [Singulisphaera sp. Ch08]|uniref:Right-handed parallel beta-helix repeat-containing protein n=1 Tax=Singulisphaera sp. Ch08 TaxID=3120278 RepID=A0AAU7C751_9BACT
MTRSELTRRGFLGVATGSLALSAHQALAEGDDRPAAINPRATDGDDVREPAWEERLTVTVGPDGKDADLVGRDDKVIQSALGYVARLGGGTVRLLPGTYTLRGPVVLPSRVRLIGAGLETILTKIPSRTVALAEDSDWYDREITLEDARGFRVGDGVVLRAKNGSNGGEIVLKRTLVARSGNRFRLDAGLRENLWLSGKPTCSALFPLLTSERTSDVVIEDLALDGDKANNENFNGNYAGCIFLQDCNKFTFRGVTARNYNGDGISFQISHDVVVERCHSHDNVDLGVHPGSGSQRPLIRANRLERNSIGLFWCWGVKYGLAEKNQIAGNRDYGVSIGHNDTDNLIRDNDIQESGKVGILFRDESRGKDFWPNRNRVEANRVTNNGPEDGVAIDVRGKTKDLKIVRNLVRETRGAMSRTGLRIGAEAGAIELAENRIEGFSKEIDDRRSHS